MSWSKGFFRLWVVLAGLWLASAVVITVLEIRDGPYFPETFAGIQRDSGEVITFERYSDEGGVYAEAIEKGDFVATIIPTLRNVSYIHGREMATVELAESADRVIALMTARQEAMYQAHRKAMLYAFAGWGLLPPVIALLSGLAIAWIATGFRSRH